MPKQVQSKWIFTWGYNRRVSWQRPEWFILPYVRIWYKSDMFLETGVCTPALTVEAGWLKWGIWGTIQEGY